VLDGVVRVHGACSLGSHVASPAVEVFRADMVLAMAAAELRAAAFANRDRVVLRDHLF
jgi:hypothetical protein